MTDLVLSPVTLTALHLGGTSGSGVTHIINAFDYGTVGDGVTDDTAACQAAIDAGTASGWPVYFGAGTYVLSNHLLVYNKTVVFGAGMGLTTFKQTVDSKRVFNRTDTSALDYCGFYDFTVYGRWLDNQTLGTDDDRHFNLYGYDRVDIHRVESVYCRQMAITAPYCNEVQVEGCRIRYCARDAINLSTSKRCTVVNNKIVHCNDDAIAIHNNTSSGNPPAELHVVTGNEVEDSYGIKMLGAVRATIADNVIVRPKGYGIYFSTSSNEGQNDLEDIVISENVINDVINSSKFGGGDQADYIYIASSTTSFANPVTGGITPVITKPDTLSYLSNAATQNAGGQRIKIHGNILATTLPPLAAYHTWGFGYAYTATSLVSNPNLSTGFQFSQYGIRLSGALLNVEVTDNTFENLLIGLAVDSGITFLDSMLVRGNTFKRLSNWGLALETAGTLRGRVKIIDNTFDLDPLFESANRTGTPLDGSWSASDQKPGAVDYVRWEHVEIRGNTFRNLNQVTHTGTGSVGVFGPNTYVMQADTSYNLLGGSSAANKGIRVPSGLEVPGSMLVTENADLTSATYGNILGVTVASSSSIPAAGYYVGGQFVKNTAITESGAGGSKYTILGWQRLTTGNAHVLDTDWRQMRCLTGN